MSRHFLRPIIIGAILLLISMMAVVPSQAASSRSLGHKPYGSTSIHHVTTPIHHISPLPINAAGTDYLYAEEGTSPDYIDAWKMGSFGKTVGHFATDANNAYTVFFGSNRLAISKQDSTHSNCLILLDTNNYSPPGYVDSFIIQSNGNLSAEVSHVQAQSSVGVPTDIHVIGDIAYVNDIGYYVSGDLESYGIGAGCALTYLSAATPPNGDVYLNTNVVGSTLLIGADYNTGNIDVYSLGSGGTITYLASTPSQITSCPDGIAVQTNGPKVFTGQCINGAPEVQGGLFNTSTGAISFLTGSPSSDPQGSNGGATTFDNTDGLLIMAEQYTSSLGVFKVSTKNMLSFLEHIPLQVSSDYPTTFAQFNQFLFVDGLYNGDIEACSLSKYGVGSCITVALLTNASGFSGGMAIL